MFNGNDKKYEIIEVNDSELVYKLKENIAFIFDGVINYEDKYLAINNWLKKNGKVKFYVLPSDLINNWYEYKFVNKKVVLVLIEDLKKEIIIKNNFRIVSKEVVSKNNFVGKIFNIEDLSISKKNKIKRYLFEKSYSLYSLIYDKEVIYSRVERYVDDTFIIDNIDEELADKVVIGKDFYILRNNILKLDYQKNLYNWVKYSNKSGFFTYPDGVYEFEFFENDYMCNQDVLKVINNKYGSLGPASLLKKEMLIKENFTLKDNLLKLLCADGLYFYNDEVDEDIIIFNEKLDEFVKKIQKEYGNFITSFEVKNWKADFVWESEKISIFVFDKGILIVCFFCCH